MLAVKFLIYLFTVQTCETLRLPTNVKRLQLVVQAARVLQCEELLRYLLQ